MATSQQLVVDVGSGAILEMTTGSFDTTGGVEWTDISWSAMDKPTIETSHLGTTVAGAGTYGSRTFIPGRNSDPGEITCVAHFNPDNVPPIDSATDTITITWKNSEGTAGAAWEGQGFMTSFELTSVGVDELMTANCTFKMTGIQKVTIDQSGA